MLHRRHFLQQTALEAALVSLLATTAWAEEPEVSLELSTFRVDVSPPHGHPLCGGWIQPVVGQDDPQQAIGLVLRGAGQPLVICSVDWTGLLNEAHVAWRTQLAAAVGTSPERVAVQCVHQHNAPFVCLEAQRLCAAQADLGDAVVDTKFFEQTLRRVASAAGASCERARPCTHVAFHQAKVDRIASNRRFLGPEGKVQDWRGSSSKEPRHKELPEGLVDPFLKTVAFYDHDRPIAACHYYATHPMSYYGDGRVSSDFVGIARDRLQAADDECMQLYFTGCAGNIAPGKYNDGTPDARRELTDRLHDSLQRSMAGLKPQPIRQVSWQTQAIQPPPRASLVAETLEAAIANRDQSRANRIRPAMMLAWLRRCQRQEPVILSALHVNSATLLHLPAETFVEYQLRAQTLAPERFVATAAYGDGGPWYIPTSECYPQGGYEVDVAFCEPTLDRQMSDGFGRLLGS
jgi:hypothetical protein